MRIIINYFHTLIHLRPKQIICQLWFRTRKTARRLIRLKYRLSVYSEGTDIRLAPFIPRPVSFNGRSFVFLNQPSERTSFVDNQGMSKLWQYNLNYMEFLLQPDLETNEGFGLIKEFIETLPMNECGIEPYPIALRGMNWIKFVSGNKWPENSSDDCILKRTDFDSSLYAQYRILSKNIEYHLMGNHLLEDAFSLLFGSFYFGNKRFYDTAKNILISELREQILEDGAHFELSPMYHQIILDRILDCINLLQNNSRFYDQDSLLVRLVESASKMSAWLKEMTFSNGEVPCVNDSAPGIAPSLHELTAYCRQLGITPSPIKLSVSGYRMYRMPGFEMLVDCGNPGPDYIPGHAHSDILSFLLNIRGNPVIVDTGVSTYERGKIRISERSTASHNTVMVNCREQSEMWDSFRVGRRAKPGILQETENSISGFHDGFKPAVHSREFVISGNVIKITDKVSERKASSVAYFHFAPGINPALSGEKIRAGHCTISFSGSDNLLFGPYDFARGFNHTEKAVVLSVYFSNSLITEIEI